MNNQKTVLKSQPVKQKQVGFVIMMTGLVGFFAAMGYFRLFGRPIGYSGIVLWKELIAFSFLTFGMYGLGYAMGGKKTAFSIATWWAVLSIGAGTLGYFGRH